MADYNTKEEGGLIDRIKESPRTVSALIIILIVAAAIYAFSGESNPQNRQTPDGVAVSENTNDGETNENDDQAIAGADADNEGSESEGAKVASGTNKTEGTTATGEKTESKPIAEPQRTAGSFIEVAEAGDGITHLARKASARWLSENQAGYAVSDEHRIYIEDYIQNDLGTKGLEMGEQMEISFELIQEAVAAANELNEGQLSNLSQYTSVLK
ncbi:MAG: hypothetical protein A3E37_03570 [Candidatus Andersenbacteria bacterium RIFCSPHIGHO2_12_FULL_46_9]|nr:MAG: hypothetical protein UW94_C0014G0033 [Parcubacteria group bacterium GW2011_GWA2_45_14]OGY34101.1 MAG: hypothetical protein A3B76_04400 [Candidatus Andersenbacteria bacterium RIFCSPHIGHO2_02_FULL_46_16]OGY35333.1 MAG: hypothetical protein A3E37_03570 [Candidatus Andersenbacteria bacterium RIFCSPHIGHO2_12_FULL_46_9]OGY36079.1 MAG: hypothetical protein A3I08_03530 [Candidatus Andersenbacteria bacterium RIFCSPLOWO2_02_FULL_46_11]OGY42004.1 MAG: hypothetical protein A3G57_03400 [Candidatus A